MMDLVVAAAVVARWAVEVCQADRSADNPCLNLSNSHRLEHHLSSQHRLLIAHLLNNPSIRVWVVVGMEVCADRWICALNLAAEVVGYKPILLYLYN
jgi:hypothetical protein